MEPYSRNVFYYETDCMAIVHNSNYLRIFEEARIDHMKQSGAPYDVMEERGIKIPQIEAHVKYKNQMKYGDIFEVHVKLEKITGARVRYSYEITVPARNASIAEGWTEHCFVDKKLNIPVNLKRKLPDMYEAMETHI
ncbi:MAG: thioesterase family protein [Firmicutes bacterium]|nr:thioesterase family protein [Bacillota bacterium]